MAFFVVFSAAAGFAQDVIVMKDGSTVLAKVLRITKTEVTYKKYNNLQGPEYTMSISDIVSINYENGTKEDFNPVVSQTEVQSSTDIFTTDVKTSDLFSSNVKTSDLFSSNVKTSDQDLLRSYNNVKDMNWKIKKRRMIGWIGGGILFITGGILFYVGHVDTYDVYVEPIGLGLIGGGIAWCVIWNISANKLKKQLDLQYTQVPLFEQDVFTGKNSKLVAGVDALRVGKMNHSTYGVGLNLKYNF